MQRLTAFNGQRGDLQSQDAPGRAHRGRYREVSTKHQTHAGVFPPDVRFAFSQLDVGVSQFQNPSAVDAEQQNC